MIGRRRPCKGFYDYVNIVQKYALGGYRDTKLRNPKTLYGSQIYALAAS